MTCSLFVQPKMQVERGGFCIQCIVVLRSYIYSLQPSRLEPDKQVASPEKYFQRRFASQSTVCLLQACRKNARGGEAQRESRARLLFVYCLLLTARRRLKCGLDSLKKSAPKKFFQDHLGRYFLGEYRGSFLGC